MQGYSKKEHLNIMRLLATFCLISLLCVMAGCKKETGILLRFHNTSDKTIFDLRVSDKEIGKLKPGKTSRFYLYEQVTFINNSVYLNVSATIDDRAFASSTIGCFTGSRQATRGVYNVEILVHPWNRIDLRLPG